MRVNDPTNASRTLIEQIAPQRNVGRRAFIRGGMLVFASTTLGHRSLMAAQNNPALKIGLITDLHHADKPPAGSRHYRETLGKFSEASEKFVAEQADFVVELGDLIDAADSVETELRYLNTIDREYSAVSKDRHYVLGNHCVDTLKKEEFLGAVGQQNSYYSFDRSGFHFVVLDSCFRGDGKPYERKNFKWTDANIPPAELEWLKADLAETDNSVIVFAHQRLDVSNHHGVRNCQAVRAILESSGKVLTVFQGHSHQNDLKQIGGIHYCTLVAMIEGSGPENNGYSMLSISTDGTLSLNGFRKQNNHTWT
jgi:predicted phosphodiesterase